MFDATLLQALNAGSGFGAFVAVFLLSAPFIWSKWQNAKKDSAEGNLYAQLSEQVAKQRIDLDAVYRERNLLAEEVYKLRSRVDQIQSAEEMVERLKEKLEQKDLVIAAKDAQIAAMMQDVLQMKDRIHHLEMRLAQDEEQFCRGCTRGAAA